MIVVRTKPPIVLSMMNELRTSQSNFWVDIAAVNSTEQTVLAGDPENVTLFSKYCETKDIKAVVLASTHAFHSRLMDSMMEDYETAATAILGRVSSKIRKECVYISGVEGKIIDTSKLQDKTYWMKHCREKVNFHEACKTARKEEDCCIFLEIGPHPVLSALAMTNMEGKSILCLPSIRRGEENWITLLDTLGKLWVSEWDGTIDWKGFDRDYNRKRIASLPFYPFVRRSIWAEMQPHTDWPLAPLLGSVVCSPSNVVLFNNYITLKRFSYLKDHTILNQVVFPAAAFLEICLCAGHAAAQGYLNDFIKPNRAVGIKDLQILAPFGVLEVSASKVQTIVKLETEEGEKTAVVYKAEVHHWLPENGGEPERNKVELNGGKWVHHANASFIPMFPSETSTKIDIRGIQNGLESKEVSTQEIYEGVSELGLRFGPTFQSLKKGWIHVEHEHEYGILFELKLPDKREECMIHPVIGDAMLQATMIWRRKLTGEKTKRRLQVPVKIANFVWFPSEVVVDEELFIYCQSNENENTSTISTSLINQRGELLGRMSGIEFIETTAKLVVGMIQQQSVQLPRTWEETLIESPGPFQGNIPYKIWETAPRLPSNSHGWLDKGRPGEQEILAFNHISKLTVFQMLKALLDLGWSPKLNEKFTTSQIMLLLGIKDNFTRYIDFFLDQMAKENMISKESDQGYIVGPGLISNVLHLGDKLKEVVSTEETSRCDYRLISEIGKRLAEIFGGKVDPLGLVLFPEDHTKPTAEGIYDFYSPELIHVGQGVNNVLTKSFPAIKADSVSNYLRILEVGGGTGVSTRAILDCIVPALEEQELNMEYVFTDISSAFFTPAKKSLEKYLNYVTFHKLDIERDPFSQGFCPEYFDVIVCAEVLHATRDIRDAVKHLKQLIKPCGSIQITETVQDDPILMFIFGLLDGYWRFTDFDLRAKSPILSASKWRKVLEVAGFTDVTLFTTSQGIHSYIHAHRQPSHLESIAEQMCHHGWLIFYDDLTQHFVSALEQKMRQIGRVFMKIRRPMRTDIDMNSITVETDMKAWIRQQIKDASFKNSKIPLEGVVYLWGVIEKDEHDQKHISLPLVSILQEILTSNVGLPSKLLFVTYRNDNPSAATLLGIVKSFVIENSHLRSTTMCLDRDDELATQVNQVFTSLWGSKNAFEYNEFCDGKRFIKRLKTKKLTSNELQLPPNCDRFQLVVPSTRQIADLEFTHLEPYTIGDDDVEVRVKAVALNFRDIFSVLKPIPLFDDMNCIGLDFSGVVTQIGSHVRKVKPGDFVICPNFDKNLALPSHVKVSQSFVMHLPEEMTFCEGATIPAAFMTGFYCLYDLGRLKKDDTLLIHAASGGVGLAAIRLAKAVNANIVATAGSDRKRAYLRSIGIVHVFNSRTTEFSEKILELTMGRGVDIVLNSLTGPGFKEASLKALAQNGRFIEMSKVQVWSVEEVAEIRPDVEYHVADITSLSEDTLKSNLIRIKNGIERHAGYNAIESLPYERFDAPDIRSALHHVQQAKHIGKVVCIMPEIARESLKMKAFVPLFNDRSTYIVTGGLGGIGFEVVKWMLRNGAKHIIIVSRSTEPAPEQAELINIFNDKTGKNVRLFSLDVSDFNKCADLFGKIQKSGYGFPKIRGIMHVAGVLENATLENQTWAMFESTYKAKVHGSWNLHLLTKHLKLEHFVMFSSIASVWGAPGQANYSASNSFQDALVHFRNSQGLPGITINWGNWGEVGIATEVDFPGVRPISTSQGLLLLGTILRAPKATQLMAANVDSFSLLSQCIPYIKQFIDETALFGETTAHAVNISSDEFWAELDAAPDRESKLNVFKNNIKRFVRSLLRIDVNENIGDTVDFQSLGIDSLMMLEMKNSLQNILGSRLIITASQVRDCNNVNLLANRLLDMIDSKEEESLIPTLEELRHLIHEDLYLVNESFLEPMKALKSEADIESLFITGVTGSLGSYILKDILSKVKSIQKIYCLVRRRGDVTGAKRLQEIMNKRGIICPTYVNIEVVEGDVGKDNLGLNHELYEELAADVDAVIHYAAKSDHIAKYWKAASSRCLDSIRNINVLGTKRVLEFASHVKTKHVFYASSLSTTTTVNEDAGTLSENWQEDNAFDTLSYNNGYLISKFISEQLVKKAWSRGLPCKSLRFGLVAGDGKTGELDILSSHYMIRLLAFLKLRCMSDIPMPSPLITPNACSEALVRICFNEKVPRGVYNVIPPHPQLEQVFVTVAEEIGVQVELVSLSDFLQKLRMERDDSPIAPLKRIYTEDGTALVEIARNISSIQKWMDDSTPDFFVSKKLTEFLPGFLDVMEPTIDIMRRDIGFAKKSGAFEMIGI
ncbi:unnamed protein product [Orchesella dallaii]|uniref:Carrier domain-containing protein n=1 Tax=Orchesella dallaii TaxID=48710 RepID=A0ABP1QVW1_9HEXA